MGPIQAISPWRGELAIHVYDNLLHLSRDSSQVREFPLLRVQCGQISFLVQATEANAIGDQQLRTIRIDVIKNAPKKVNTQQSGFAGGHLSNY